MKRATDVVVIGGGLAGLTSAATLGRAGRAVVLPEKARSLGGRPRAQGKHEFSLNLGERASNHASVETSPLGSPPGPDEPSTSPLVFLERTPRPR